MSDALAANALPMNEFTTGEFVVMIKWYEFVQEQANGDRLYKLQALPPKREVHSVISFVQDAPKICFKSYEKGCYT